MSQTLYIRPDLNWAFGKTVTQANGDPDHELSWLVDGRVGFPLRLTVGTGVITISGTAGAVNLVAVCHHLLDAALHVVLGGDLAGSIIIPDYPENGVPFNAWILTDVGSPDTVDSITLSITGNSTDILIGEVFAGQALALEPSLKLDDAQFSIQSFRNSTGTPLSGIPPYTEGAEARPVSGSQYYPQAGLDAILAWWRSQDASAYLLPSLLILDSDDDTDARVVTLQNVSWSRVGPVGSDTEYLVRIDFLEYPRTRW